MRDPTTPGAHQHTHKCKGRQNSAILDHMIETGHIVREEDFRILHREQNWRLRGIREAIEVRKRNPAINKRGGIRYKLSPLWDKPLGALRTVYHQ